MTQILSDLRKEVAAVTSNNEVIQARGGYPTLNDRLDDITSGGAASVTAGDGISVTGSVVAVDNSVLRTSRAIISGDGLAGGGALSSDRTLAVDGTVVRTSRTVTAGAGLTGGGDLSANRSLALQTPGALTDETTNSATGSHTHAVTASADPGQASSLLKTNGDGRLTLSRFQVSNLLEVISETNLMPNPSFEDADISNWGDFPGSFGGWFARSDSSAQSGTWSLKIEWMSDPVDEEPTGTRSDAVTISTDRAQIKLAARAQASPVRTPILSGISVIWLNSSDEIVGTAVITGSGGGSLTTSWQTFQSTLTKPSGATKFRFEIGNKTGYTCEGTNGTYGIFLDAIEVYEVTESVQRSLDADEDGVGFDLPLRLRPSAAPDLDDNEAGIYLVGSKLVVVYDDDGTLRYKYLELSGTGATLTHTTTAP